MSGFTPLNTSQKNMKKAVEFGKVDVDMSDLDIFGLVNPN